jgi:hypothetical protein
MAAVRFSSWNSPHLVWYGLFLGTLGFSTVHPYLPKPISQKWVKEDLRRTRALGVAVSEITSAMWNRAMKPDQLQALFAKLLSTVKSEIEDMTGDQQGMYLNVSLFLQDGDDRLRAVCRANPDRGHSSYKRGELLISECLKSGQTFYEPDFKSADKPYKSIFAVPLLFKPENSRTCPAGILSIDSEESHAFDHLKDEIETKTLPYVSLLTLAIVTDQTLKNGKGRHNARNC